MEKLNLKKLLMEMGNHLVLNCRHDPAMMSQLTTDIVHDNRHSTIIIAMFTEWLNKSAEAQMWLEEQGIDWPVVKR
jgi:hypothetical protein